MTTCTQGSLCPFLSLFPLPLPCNDLPRRIAHASVLVLSHTTIEGPSPSPKHDPLTSSTHHSLPLPLPVPRPPHSDPLDPPLPQGQLQAFLTLLKEGEKELCDAAFADLHKSSFEAYSTEISLCEGEIHTAMAGLKEWMKPVSTGSSALNFPCWSSTQRDPLGVVLVLGAWNYPIQLCLAPLVGAIAGGNCVLLKPGSYAVNTSHCIARLFNKYMDTDCIRVAEGDRKVTSAILDQAFDKIFFTGSGYVGKIVAAAAAKHLTPCILELGGKSPTIVDKTANLEHAARRICWGTFLNGGQTCVRPDFAMVHADVVGPFLEEMKKAVLDFYGDDSQESEWYGRCINDKAFERLSAIVDSSRDRIVLGSGRVDAKDKYVEPTVLNYGADMAAFTASAAMQDEIFGPILPMVTFTSMETVISYVKALPTGKPLALYAFSQDNAVIETIKRRTTSGGLVINDNLMHLANHELPFGGIGASGMGAYHGERSFSAFTHEKAVLEKSQMLDQSIVLKPLLQARFPPYNSTKKALVKIFMMPFASTILNLHRNKKFLMLVAVLLLYKMGFRVIRN